MAIFSGNIIEAYYANENNDTVEVIYKQGEQAINHFLKVDYKDQDFKDLIAEYDTDKIAGSTIARNRQYAKQLSDMVDQGIKSKTDVKQKVSVEEYIDSMLNFNSSATCGIKYTTVCFTWYLLNIDTNLFHSIPMTFCRLE